MIVTIICFWYLIGALSLGYTLYTIEKGLSLIDLIVSLTIGGVFGLVSFCGCLAYFTMSDDRRLPKWLYKKII
jgi:hypothetical protein